VSLGLGRSEMTACPFLGLQGDAHSRALYARSDHVCGLAPRRGLDVSWQNSHCLCQSHRHCPRFRAVQTRSILRPVIVTSARRGRPRSALIAITVVVLIWLTSAVSATIVLLNHPNSAPPPAEMVLPIRLPQVGTISHLHNRSTFY
jgi:hypothetical protein